MKPILSIAAPSVLIRVATAARGNGSRMVGLLIVCALTGGVVNHAQAEKARVVFTLACSPENDLLSTMRKSGLPTKRYATPVKAIQAAKAGSAVLLLADHYPTNTLELSAELYREAAAKNLRLYVEFPAYAPGVSFGAARKLNWERLVVSSDQFGVRLPKGMILMQHDSEVLPVTVPSPLVVAARVAGYDKAVYGIPGSAQPVLFALEEGRVLVATTRLSSFITGRYAPVGEWKTLWGYILRELAGADIPDLAWEQRVQPSYGPHEPLPRDFEKNTFQRASRWYHDSGLLVTEEQWPALVRLLKGNVELTNSLSARPRTGDGKFGILEGYASGILADGNQPKRTPIRADCQAESAMVLAMDWGLNHKRASQKTAENLLDFLYYKSDLCGGPRGNPKHPAFGLISWGSISPAWTVGNYGDDNARVMLATMLAAACLDSDRWDKPLLRGLMANLRTTGKLGFRGDRVDVPPLEKHGWKHFHDAATINYAPPFEGYNWACFLWAYAHTGEPDFLEKTKTAIRMTMEAFPDKWRWNDNSERARMLLCLAWLVRVEDTAEHRGWLKRVTDDLISIQDGTGAIPERFRGAVGSHYQIPQSNEAYGTGETPLLQQNGDPVSDQLYVTGFTLLAFHEAAAVLHDARIAAAEDKLAGYLCRIQIRSRSVPYLDGTWFRAFDFKRWEPWASSGDFGWGAWSVEAGWGQAWTAGVLGLREKKTTLWELTARTRIREQLPKVCEEMAQNTGGPWKPAAAASAK